VYDPATRRWTGTGSLRQARGAGHTATLLADGRVLVAGGQCDGTCWQHGSATARAEVYDPRRGSWTEVAPMSAARYLHTATLLADGRVLVAGGYGGQPWGTADLFDPATGAWSPAGPMVAARDRHAAVRLRDGRVLLGGGECNPACPAVATASAEIYNPATNSFSATAPMRLPRMGHAFHLLSTGRVLNVGGWTPSTGATERTELYRPDPGTWSAAAPMMLRRSGSTSVVTRAGRVLVVGGSGNNGESPRTAESYDAVGNRWRSAGSLLSARDDFAVAALGDGGVLVAGGSTGCFPNCMVSGTERYDGTTEVGVPYPPTGLLANNGDRSITFSWKPPSKAGSGPVTGYTVRVTSSKGQVVLVTAGAADTKVVVSGLTNGVRYSAMVRAENQSGSSFWSRGTSAVPAPG
jgi:hypothetical protein